MVSQGTKPARQRHGARAMIPCCHGWIYTVSENALGIIAESSGRILGRLRKIDGVKLFEKRGDWCDLTFPPIRLPEVARVLVPLDSARARTTLAMAAHRGRIW